MEEVYLVNLATHHSIMHAAWDWVIKNEGREREREGENGLSKLTNSEQHSPFSGVSYTLYRLCSFPSMVRPSNSLHESRRTRRMKPRAFESLFPKKKMIPKGYARHFFFSKWRMRKNNGNPAAGENAKHKMDDKCVRFVLRPTFHERSRLSILVYNGWRMRRRWKHNVDVCSSLYSSREVFYRRGTVGGGAVVVSWS